MAPRHLAVGSRRSLSRGDTTARGDTCPTYPVKDSRFKIDALKATEAEVIGGDERVEAEAIESEMLMDDACEAVPEGACAIVDIGLLSPMKKALLREPRGPKGERVDIEMADMCVETESEVVVRTAARVFEVTKARLEERVASG